MRGGVKVRAYVGSACQYFTSNYVFKEVEKMNKGYKKVNGLELAQMAIALEREVRAGGALTGKTAVLEALIKVYNHLRAGTYMIKDDELDEIRAYTTKF